MAGQSDESDSKVPEVTEFDVIVETAAEFKVLPGEIIEKYSPRQIREIYASIVRKRTEERNTLYNVFRFAIGSAFQKNPPDRIFVLNNESPAENDKKENKKPTKYASIGLASDLELENPDLKVFDSTEGGNK